MTMTKWGYWLLLGLFLFLVACQPANTATITTPAAAGEIIFWRMRGDETNEATWQLILDRFQEIFPQISVIQSVYDPEEYRERLETATDMGVGPDMFIAPNEWITDLAGREMIQPVDETKFNLDVYLSAAVNSLRYEDALYGVPISLNNNALYYNLTMVEVPPAETLDELLQHAQNGMPVAITSTFDEAFWGIQAFGGRIFDENNQIVLTEGGLANWLAWLQNAQDEPGMIINSDKVALRELFIAGEAAYYVGAPQELAGLQAALGPENIAVASLPSGPQGPAGPLLSEEAVLFSPNSSVSQSDLAIQLARFITNTEQGSTLLRETGRIPANTRVQVDRRIYPEANIFAAQARTAVALANVPQADQVRNQGNDLYRAVLSGVTLPADAVMLLNNNLNGDAVVVAATDEPSSFDCSDSGTVTVWHSLADSVGRALADIAFDFGSNCPGTTIVIGHKAEDELLGALENEPENLPEILLVPQTMLAELVAGEQVIPVTNTVNEEIRQRFFARAYNTLLFENELYGFPFALGGTTLYRNVDMAADAPVTLDDLLLQVNNDVPLAFPVNGRDSFWGITAYTGPVLSEEGYFLPDPVGLVDWLTWLNDQKTRPGMLFGADHDALRDQFAAGEAGLFIGRAGDFPILLDTISSDNLRTASLPAGPQGPGHPLLIVESFLFTTVAEENLAAALAFVDYATSSEVQLKLMTRERLVPANINVSMENFPNVAILQAQAQNAEVLPHGFPYTFAAEEANRMYDQVLNQDQAPAEAACAFILAVNEEMGLELTLDDLGPICTAEE